MRPSHATFHSRFHAVIAVVLAALPLAAHAARAEQPRVVVVLEENVDGKRAAVGTAEAAITSALMKDGWRVVAGDAADKLRKAQAVSLALSGSVPDVLSSLDADLVVLGQINVSKIGAIEDAGLIAFRSVATAKLVRVDTAQIVEAFSVEGSGRDFADAGAAQKAARSVGEALATQVKAANAAIASGKRARVIDLVIHGVPDRAQLEALKASLARAKGVSNVVVRQSGKGLTKIEVSTQGDGEALATEIERAGAPLEIVQTSAAAILARHDVRRGVKLGATLLTPTVKVARGEWLKGALTPLLESELSNVTWLDVVAADVADVKLEVSATSAGKDQLALTITALEATSAKKLFTTSATGKLDDVGAVVSAAVKKLDEGFLPALARAGTRSSEGALTRAVAAGKSPQQQASTTNAGEALGVPELRIEALSLESLFPAKLGYYATHPVGAVTVRHLDAKGVAAENVVVSVYVSRFMQLRTEIPVGTIKPGETRVVPLTVGLDSATVFTVEENTPTQAEVIVEYAAGGANAVKRTARRVAPVVVYGRHAIDWSENEPITAFVTPQEENVRQFARAAVLVDSVGTNGANDLPPSITQAIAMFSAMNAAELKYVKDPATPARSVSLDTVQFARETLLTRAGDCDDLSVLYASLLESVGVETAFLLVPGHVLLAVNAGVSPDATERVTMEGKRLVVHEGKAWLPVETTALGKTFREAWSLGTAAAERARKDKSELIVVETRAGWSTYPPAALPRAAGLAIAKPDAKKSGAADEVKAVVAARDVERSAKMNELAAAIAKDPSSPSALAYAAFLSRAGDAPSVQKARSVLEAFVQKKPKDAAALNNLANIDVLAGDPAAAIGRYRTLLDDRSLKANKRGELLTNLGLAYARAGDSMHAVDAFDAALADGATHVFVASGFVKSGGVVTAPATRAADASSSAASSPSTAALERELHAILEKAAVRHSERAAKNAPAVAVDAKRFTPPDGKGAGGAVDARRDDAASRARAAELLRWWS